MIAEAKAELFLCGYDVSRILANREEILIAADKVRRIRVLAMDMDNKMVREQFTATFGRPPGLKNLDHLNAFLSKQNIEIRTISFPMMIYATTKDVQGAAGRMQVGFLGYAKSGYNSYCLNLTPGDGEWYDYYKVQMELLWEQGTPWKPREEG